MKRDDINSGGVALGYLQCAVATGLIDNDQQLVHPLEAQKAALEKLSLVPRQNRRGDRGGSVQYTTSIQVPPTLSSWKAIPSWISPA